MRQEVPSTRSQRIMREIANLPPLFPIYHLEHMRPSMFTRCGSSLKPPLQSRCLPPPSQPPQVFTSTRTEGVPPRCSTHEQAPRVLVSPARGRNLHPRWRAQDTTSLSQWSTTTSRGGSSRRRRLHMRFSTTSRNTHRIRSPGSNGARVTNGAPPGSPHSHRAPRWGR